MKKTRHILSVTLIILFVFIGFLATFSAGWCKEIYGNIGFEAILFTMFSSLEGVAPGIILGYLLHAGLPALLCSAAICFLLLFKPKKRFKFCPLPIKRWIALILSVIICISQLYMALKNLNGLEYISAQLNPSMFIENEYVYPNEVKIEFPEKKRNLIYLIMESMETTFYNKEQSGGYDYNVIPELYKLAERNLNFSDNDKVGGFNTVTGATWTIASIVSQTSGLPLKIPHSKRNKMNNFKSFLPGAYTINDILHENGYRQSFMCGSDGDFGGRKQYFQQHGVDTIYDLMSARETGIVSPDYWDEFWGMEDHYLYDYAKRELPKIAKSDEPFAFFMLTVDTHHIEGHPCINCTNTYEEQYENVYSCASKQMNKFINWLKTQPFYKDTTVIIVGDHRSMADDFFKRTVEEGYDRKIYNCILNPVIDAENSKNRTFVPFDLFPTTLASIGCTIEGEQLGLGVNLFSDKPTLAEKYGLDMVNAELGKKSKLYDDELLDFFSER